MDPDQITRELKLNPVRSWKSGEPRTTPVGTPLSGTNKQSYWVHSDEISGKRLFSRTVEKWLSVLEGRSDFIKSISETNGVVSVNINLFGGANIGDVMTWPVLARLAALKIHLGIEVFPKMDFGNEKKKIKN